MDSASTGLKPGVNATPTPSCGSRIDNEVQAACSYSDVSFKCGTGRVLMTVRVKGVAGAPPS